MDGLLKHVNKSQEMTLTLYIAFLHAVCLWKGGPGVGGDMRRKPCSPPPPPPTPIAYLFPIFIFALGITKICA